MISENISLYIDFAQNVILDFVLIILWYIFFYGYREKILPDIFVFPLTNFPAILNPYKFPAVIPIIYFYLAYAGDIIMVASDRSWDVYLVLWSITMILRFGLSILYLVKKKAFCYPLIFIFILTVIICAIVTMPERSFDPIMSPLGFYLDVFLFLCSFYIVVRIIYKHLFAEKFLDFFVFFGLFLHSFLQILSTISMVPYCSNVLYTFITPNNVLKIFWIISVPWILNLRKKFAEES